MLTQLNRIAVSAGAILLALASPLTAQDGVQQPAAASDCVLVSTPADLNNVRNNLAGDYCLANDINFHFEELEPIGKLRATVYRVHLTGKGMLDFFSENSHNRPERWSVQRNWKWQGFEWPEWRGSESSAG